jgi:hypothetical protein
MEEGLSPDYFRFSILFRLTSIGLIRAHALSLLVILSILELYVILT